MKWYNWIELSKENLKHIAEMPGAYQIRWANKNISRLLGKDNNGILMIGESKNLKKRISQFFRSSRPDYKSALHAEGNRFHNVGLHKIVKKMEFRYIITKDKRTAKKLQDNSLIKYQLNFGEVPPLNNSGGEEA